MTTPGAPGQIRINVTGMVEPNTPGPRVGLPTGEEAFVFPPAGGGDQQPSEVQTIAPSPPPAQQQQQPPPEQQQQQQQQPPPSPPEQQQQQYNLYWQGVMDGVIGDWHLQKQSDPSQPLFYSIPIYFQSDWLNEQCLAENKDDFRFVYMGGDGTNTPLHMDVLGTYSWSANICGQKRWRFSKPYSFEFIQEAGEIVFVPSQWYHDVTNIGHTISINHNWFNAFNIFRIWKHLCLTLDDIEHRIEDCRSIMSETWYEHCQLILQTNEGINFASLYQLLYTIARNRLENSNNNDYVKFDLWIIDKLIRNMLHTPAFLYAFDFDTFPQRPKVLLKEIYSCIEKAKQ